MRLTIIMLFGVCLSANNLVAASAMPHHQVDGLPSTTVLIASKHSTSLDQNGMITIGLRLTNVTAYTRRIENPFHHLKLHLSKMNAFVATYKLGVQTITRDDNSSNDNDRYWTIEAGESIIASGQLQLALSPDNELDEGTYDATIIAESDDPISIAPIRTLHVAETIRISDKNTDFEPSFGSVTGKDAIMDYARTLTSEAIDQLNDNTTGSLKKGPY